MNCNERLFLAIGAADGELLRRCETAGKRRRRLWIGALSAAACLALILTVLLSHLDFQDTTGSGGSDIPTVSFTPQSEESRFHFLRLTAGTEGTAFVIYINEESYRLTEEDGDYLVRPKSSVESPEGELPPCELRISHQPQLSMEQAKTQLPERWREAYPELSGWEESPPYLWGQNGSDWNSPYLEAYLVEDGEGGVYVLTVSCFMEAVEGHGRRLADMARTFRPICSGTPDWLTALEETAQRLTRAALAGDFSDVEELLSPEAEVSGCGEDISRYASVTGFDYTVDDVETPAEAEVSVEYHEDIQEPPKRLTVRLRFQEGRWLAEEIAAG